MIRLGLPASIRGRLLGLLLLATLPALLLAAIGEYAAWQGALHDAERRLERERDQVVALNRDSLAAANTLLATLALSISASPEDCATLLAPAQASGLDPIVIGPGGHRRCGNGTPPTAAREVLGSALPTLRAGEGTVVLIGHPIADGDTMLFAAIPLVEPDAEARLWLIDSEAGAPPTAPWLATPEEGGASARVAGPDGTGWLAAAGKIAPGLQIVLARPEAPIQRAALSMALRRLGEIAALLALAGIAVFLGAGRAVNRPLAKLRAAVARWRTGAKLELEEGADLPEELNDLAQAFREGTTALAERDAALEAAVARAELLAEEVHHRVKNNLQIVSSLLALQAGRVADPAARAEFEATRDRVAAIATLHRHMYVHHDPEAIDLRAFLQELGEQLFAGIGERPGRRIGFVVDASPLRIASDQAVPLALLITEAVSMALKHGFPGTRRGRIAIRLAARGGRAALSVEDNGAWPRAEDRLRASLMRGFARQLGSELVVEEGRLSLDLPLRSPLPRQRVRVKGS